MKVLVPILIGLLVVGCGKKQYGNTNESNNTPKISAKKKVEKITPSEENVVGTYELKVDGNSMRLLFLENGNFESYRNGKKSDEEGKWKISEEGEIHFTDSRDGDIGVFRINPDSSITVIAGIRDGKRRGMPKEKIKTLKKIK